MYIEQGYKGLNELWRYAVGVLIIFIGWQFIGAGPLVLILLAKAVETGNYPTDVASIANLLGSNLFFFLALLTFVVGFLALYLT